MGQIKSVIVMVLVQIAITGMNVLYKLATNDGMSSRVILAYRYIFATAFLFPLALYVERGSRPKLTWMVLFQAFLCGLFGALLSPNLYLDSLVLTSATFASALSNLSPVMTFILAVSFRMERVNFGKAGGKAKVLGALTGIGGALILILYRGVEINIWPAHVNLMMHSHQRGDSHRKSSAAHTLFGSLLALASCFTFCLWLIIQAKMSERYPCHYSSVALVSLMGALENVAYALCFDRDWAQWKLGWNIRLLTVAYSGIVCSGIAYVSIAWCIHTRGPLFVSAFNPLTLVLIALFASLLLNEKLYLGMVLASILIVTGLYMVLWGNARNDQEAKQKKKKKKKINTQILVELDQIDQSILNQEPKSSLEQTVATISAPEINKSTHKIVIISEQV